MNYKKQFSIKSRGKLYVLSVGFTLIELLVSVSILTILSGAVISIINNSGLQSKARDSQRIADVKKIQVALELYFADNRAYPGATAALSPNFISQIPTDPQTAGNYGYSSTGAKYVVYIGMEVATSALKGPCASLGYAPAPAYPANCYGVINP